MRDPLAGYGRGVVALYVIKMGWLVFCGVGLAIALAYTAFTEEPPLPHERTVEPSVMPTPKGGFKIVTCEDGAVRFEHQGCDLNGGLSHHGWPHQEPLVQAP